MRKLIVSTFVLLDGIMLETAEMSADKTLQPAPHTWRRRASLLKSKIVLRVFFMALLFFSNIAFASEDILLNVGGIDSPIAITGSVVTRGSPHIYFDQAIASIVEIQKDVKFLCKRRVGHFEKILYSMYCYTNTTDNNLVIVGGEIVIGNRAWYFDAKLSNENFSDQLIILIEAIQGLPYNKALQRISR